MKQAKKVMQSTKDQNNMQHKITIQKKKINQTTGLTRDESTDEAKMIQK